MSTILCTALLLATITATMGPAQTTDIAAVVREVQRYDYTQPRAPLFTLDDYAARVTGDVGQQKAFAALLATALADPQSTPLARTLFCQKLAVAGTDAEVPALAKLLDDPQLADAARLALEGLRSPVADAALRASLARLEGRALHGAIQSLGNRRDAEAVTKLAGFLRQPDHAPAAAQALAAIATPSAAAALADSNDTDAKLRCAQRRMAAGDAATALSLCKPLLAPGQPADRRVATLSLLARADAPEARALLLGAIGDTDDFVAASALRVAVIAKEAVATTFLTEQLKKSAPARRALILAALGERRDGSAAPAVAEEVGHPDDQVAVAALLALGAVGNERNLELLARVSATGKGVRKAAAEEAMANLTGDAVDRAICAGIASGTTEARSAMVAAAGLRNLVAAVPALLAAATGGEEPLRVASAQTLAKIGRASDYESLVQLLGAAADTPTREALADTVAAVGRRIPDARQRVAPLQAAFGTAAAPESRAALLRALGAIGGPDALSLVAPHAASADPILADAAVRALAAWPDVSAAETLAGLAAQAKDPVHRTLALRGVLRLAAASGQAISWIERIRPFAKSADDKRQLLAAVSSLKSPESLGLAMGLLVDPEVTAEAAVAAVQVGKGLVRSHAAEVDAAMTKVLAAAKDTPEAADLQAQARKALGAKSMKSKARRDTIAQALPAGAQLAAYLDCGVDAADSGPGGLRLWVEQGRTFDWSETGDEAETSALTVAFDGGRVRIGATGLHPAKAYELGFTWWDHDNNQRAQSVSVDGQPLVAKTVLPAWHGRQQGPATWAKPLPAEVTRDGTIEIVFKQEAAGNVVVSEVWLVERGTAATIPAATTKPAKRALIVTGMEYPGHKWRETAPFLRDLIAEDARIGVEINEDAKAALESPSLGSNDVIVLNYMNWENPGPGDAAQEGLRKAVENGTGLVLVHFACGAFQTWPEFVKIAGRVWNPKFRGHDPRGPFQVNIVDAQHAITKGMSGFGTDDELYTCLDGQTPIHVLADANSKVDHKDYPMAFVLQYGKGRVFLSTLGHDVKALAFPEVKTLYRRATTWAAQLPPES